MYKLIFTIFYLASYYILLKARYNLPKKIRLTKKIMVSKKKDIYNSFLKLIKIN